MEFKDSGVDKIYNEDYDTQVHFLKTFTEVRDVDLNTLLELKCFFVPNNDYIMTFFGEGSTDSSEGLYDHEGYCTFLHNLVIPIRNVVGEVVAFIGYDFLRKLEDKESTEKSIVKTPYYSASSKKVWNSRDYLFFPGKSFDLMLEKNYVIILDGMFDAISAYADGHPSCGFFGSQVNQIRMMQLEYCDNLYVAKDNDRAGDVFFSKIKKYRPDAKMIRQNVGKDYDDVTHSPYREEYLKGLSDSIKSGVDYSLIIKPNLACLDDILNCK